MASIGQKQQEKDTRKLYVPPMARQLSLENAKEILLHLADPNDHEAQGMLKRIENLIEATKNKCLS